MADTEQTVEHYPTFESDDEALQSTGKVVIKESREGDGMPSVPPGEIESSNAEDGLTSGATISNSSTPSNTVLTSQPNDEQTVNNDSPRQSTNNVSDLDLLEQTDRLTPLSPEESCEEVEHLHSEYVARPNVSFIGPPTPRQEGIRRWRYIYQNGPSYRRARRINKPLCPYTTYQSRYSLSCMVLYIIMTHFFARLYFLNKAVCKLSACSVYIDLLSMHWFNLITFAFSLSTQIIMDIFHVRTKNSCIFNLAIFAIHISLLLFVFGYISYCQGSHLDYIFPALTLIMCIGYTILEMLSLIKIRRNKMK